MLDRLHWQVHRTTLIHVIRLFSPKRWVAVGWTGRLQKAICLSGSNYIPFLAIHISPSRYLCCLLFALDVLKWKCESIPIGHFTHSRASALTESTIKDYHRLDCPKHYHIVHPTHCINFIPLPLIHANELIIVSGSEQTHTMLTNSDTSYRRTSWHQSLHHNLHRKRTGSKRFNSQLVS